MNSQSFLDKYISVNSICDKSNSIKTPGDIKIRSILNVLSVNKQLPKNKVMILDHLDGCLHPKQQILLAEISYSFKKNKILNLY